MNDDFIDYEEFKRLNAPFINLKETLLKLSMTGDTSDIESIISALFDLETGLPATFSRRTYNGKSVFLNSYTVKYQIWNLRTKYHNMFKYHVHRQNCREIPEKVQQLIGDIDAICNKYLVKEI